MPTEIPGIVTLLKAGTLATGGLITYYSARAYRRTGDPALRMLAIGFGIITVGSMLAGVVDRLLPLAREHALVVESVFTLVGFGIVLYSLFMTDASARPTDTVTRRILESSE